MLTCGVAMQVCTKYPGRQTLKVPSGYRKITGNKCSGGVNLGGQVAGRDVRQSLSAAPQVMHCTADDASGDTDTTADNQDEDVDEDAEKPDENDKTGDEFPPNGESPVPFKQVCSYLGTAADMVLCRKQNCGCLGSTGNLNSWSTWW